MEVLHPLWGTPEAEGRFSTAAAFLALELAVVVARLLFCGVRSPLSWVIVTYCGIAEWVRETDQVKNIKICRNKGS